MALADPLDSARHFGLVEDEAVALAQGSPFVISELTGQQRSVRLAGRALPKDKLKFSGTMRLEQTWYPGNPQATFQVFGASEDESTFTGEWKDRFLSSANDPAHAHVQVINTYGSVTNIRDVMGLVKLVDDIRRQGQLLRITWDEIVREGILSKFTHTWKRRQDVEWEMTFAWGSQGEGQAAVAAIAPSLGDTKSELAALVSTLSTNFENYRNKIQTGLLIAQDFQTAVRQNIKSIQSAMQDVEDLVAKTIDITVEAAEAGRRVVAIFTFAKTMAQSIVDQCEQRTGRGVLTATSPATLHGGTVVAAENYLRTVRGNARDLRDFSARKGFEHATHSDSTDIVQIFVARDGQDLRDVSKRFYSTPEQWKTLMSFNHLTSSKLQPGQLVYVPAVPRGG